MYEDLTKLIDTIDTDPSSRRTENELIETVYELEENGHDYLYRYEDVLNAAGIEWGYDSMLHADVSALDGKTVLALIFGVARAERFQYEGLVTEFMENGTIKKWLLRLRDLDQA